MQKSLKGKLNSGFELAEQSPGFLLWKAANLLQRSHGTCLRELHITPAQFSMMTCLVYLNQSGDVNSALIARHAGMDKMMVSDLVKTLFKKGLLKTKPNTSDGRSFFIVPTKIGTEITNSAVQKIEALDDKFFQTVKSLNTFTKELKALIDAQTDVHPTP